MKRFKIIIEANDSSGAVANMIQLFFKGLKLRGLIAKALYSIEEINDR